MRATAWLSLVFTAAVYMSPPVQAQTPDDDLRVYAVNVVKTPPLAKQFTGYGIYLGKGLVVAREEFGSD